MGDSIQERGMKKTEYLLTVALRNLLKTHLFSRITVNDICIEAMVSRSAFYTYFEDKYALLRFMLDMANAELIHRLKGKPLRAYIQAMLSQVKAERSLFRNIISSGYREETSAIILHMHFENIRNAMIHQYEGDREIPVEVVAYYHASAVVNTIIQWVEHNMDYSIEEMTSYLVKILPPGLREISLPFDEEKSVPL